MRAPLRGEWDPRGDKPAIRSDVNVAEANRLLYERIATTYDESEECVIDGRLRTRLLSAVQRALAELPTGSTPNVLDACGGSGNVSLLLLELGLRPVTVDISPKMLSILEAKARTRSYSPTCITSEISTFLETDSRSWDLIIFSSALHHIDDFDAVLDRAISRLKPHGILLTMFDPTRVGPTGRWLRRIDYFLHVVIRTPNRIPVLLKARLSRPISPVDELRSIGVVAERHALSGIDDVGLARRLDRAGNMVLEHERYFEGRFWLTRVTFSALRQPSSFHIMVKTP